MPEAFASLPLPPRSEAWKYTDPARLLKDNPDLVAATGGLPCATSLFDSDQRLLLVDGVWQAADSSSALPLQAVSPAAAEDDLAALRQRAARQAYRLELPADSRELHLLLLASEDQARLAALELDIHVAAGARASVLIEQAGGAPGGLSLLSLNVELEAGASLDLLRCQHLHAEHSLLARQSATVGADARLRQTHVEWGARLSRLASRLCLTAPGASLDFHALSGLAGRQHGDHQVEVRHEAPQGRSRLRARGLIDGRARQVFNGKVHVARGAQGTDSDQLLRNLLLSDRAEVDAKPELEIFADDVRCAHGSTVGQLDAAALFYLRSRGLDESQARRLLMLSFAESVLASIANETRREQLRDAFAAHLQLRDAP